jgi:hypothetical protein
MLILQTPGAFMFVFFLALLYHDDFTTWVPPLVSGIEQSILLGMCIYYWVEEYRAKKKEEKQPLLVNDESTVNKDTFS